MIYNLILLHLYLYVKQCLAILQAVITCQISQAWCLTGCSNSAFKYNTSVIMGFKRSVIYSSNVFFFQLGYYFLGLFYKNIHDESKFWVQVYSINLSGSPRKLYLVWTPLLLASYITERRITLILF